MIYPDSNLSDEKGPNSVEWIENTNTELDALYHNIKLY